MTAAVINVVRMADTMESEEGCAIFLDWMRLYPSWGKGVSRSYWIAHR